MTTRGHTKPATFRWNRADGSPGAEGFVNTLDEVKLFVPRLGRYVRVAQLDRVDGGYRIAEVDIEYRASVGDPLPDKHDSRPSAGRWLAKRLDAAGRL
jgi:hypothetical protein